MAGCERAASEALTDCARTAGHGELVYGGKEGGGMNHCVFRYSAMCGVFCLTALCIASCAWASERTELPISTRELMACAEAGDAQCQSALAQCYYLGESQARGLAKDIGLAMSWYEKAAEGGDAEAQSIYGLMLQMGWNGVGRDVKRAFLLFAKAAVQGHPRSQYRVGECYAKGLGVAADGKKAERWLLKAAQREFLAYDSLDDLYREGTVVRRNLTKADYWKRRYDDEPMECRPVDSDAPPAEQNLSCYKKARQGSAAARKSMGDAYYFGGGLPENTARARYWYRLAAWQEYTDAQLSLGNLYLSASGVRDRWKARYWYLKAASQGENSWFYLGLLDEGNNPRKAAYWYAKGAGRGDSVAQYTLGKMYEQGRGVAKDPARAASLYRAAALLQNAAMAKLYLGALHERGTGVAKDPALAMAWYLDAAEQGEPAAQNQLAVAYAAGEITAKDPVAALKWGLLAERSSRFRERAVWDDLRETMSDDDKAKAIQQAGEWIEKKKPPQKAEDG